MPTDAPDLIDRTVDLDYIRRRHVWNMHAGIEECVICGEGWPCDATQLLALIDAAPAAEPVPLTLDALTRALRFVAETEPGTLAHADQENGGLGPEYAARSIHEALAALASPDKGEPGP